ncbi:SprT family zinc-dependent metalloprotease [Bowmanella denitrificans]|uniref:SprT family zinc-dependent metalloprotease n=1 Tax=Bowmanella denitrificans TaxID=366582 RepID=UPI002481F0EA|nr:SprT family zinc-dependent metalloprotease [Bowmanella denitrificans]
MANLCPELIQSVENRLEQCLVMAQSQLGRTFATPSLSYDQRGRIAGSARLQANHIRLNAQLLADNPEEFMREVIPHELCHLLVWQLYGRGTLRNPVRPHGPQWKELMRRLFGLQGSACHQMDISKVAGRQFTYHCHCGPVQLSIRRHNRVLQGVSYQCRHCRQTLVSQSLPAQADTHNNSDI